MKRLLSLFTTLLFLSPLVAVAQGNMCAEAQPFCTDSGITFPAGVNVEEAAVAEPGNDYNCLGTSPNPAWYYLQVDDPGDINILQTNSNSVDVDFALWGPFPNLAAAIDNCGSLGTTADCSYSAAAVENIDIFDANSGDVYLLLITNYSNSPTEINAVQIDGEGSTDCDIVTCEPAIAAPQSNAQVCNGGTIELVGLPNIEGASYLWTGPNGFISGLQNPTISGATPNQSGNYTLIITTECDSDPVSVSVLVLPTISSTTSVSICPGETYFAGGADQNQSGIYTDSFVDANGCENITTTILTVREPLLFYSTVSICDGQSIFLGGASQSTAGIYTDVFTASTGCDSTVVTQLDVLPQPPEFSVASAVICDGAVAPLDATVAAYVSYAWNNGQSTPIINATTAGTYTVTISNSCGQRSANATVSITPTPTVDLGDAAQSFCLEQSNTLDATNEAATYAWSTGSTDAQISITETGVYAVTVTNECGTTTDRVCATVDSCDPACAGLELLHSYICNANGFTYQIYGGAQGGAAPYAVTGSYTGALAVDNELFMSDNLTTDTPYQLTVVDANGCVRSVLECEPICSILPVSLLRFTGDAIAAGNYLTWTTANETNNDYFTLYRSMNGSNWQQLAIIDGSGNTNTSKNYQYLDKNAPDGVAYYQLTQTDFDGTTAQVGTVSLQRGAGSSQLNINTIQPVPVQNAALVTFSSPKTQQLSLSLYSVVGQLLYSTNLSATEGINTHSVDLSNLPAGVYALTIASSDARTVQTLVKQ